MHAIRANAARIASRSAVAYLHATRGFRRKGDPGWLITHWRGLVYARRAKRARAYAARRSA